MKNSNLSKAKAEKNDEFYTRLEDIELELSHYPERYFRDKIIYLPCDVAIDGTKVPKSNFVKYFQINRARLGYKKLIATSINNEKNLYMLEQDGTEFNEHCPKDSEYVSGDYRSEYCQKLFKEADVVVTNPPFSLFRDFVANLEKHELKYVLWGNNNAIITKDIFILVQQNKLWLGYTFNKNLDFRVPIGYAFNKEIDGIKYGTVPAISVFTNYEIDKQHDLLILTKKYDDTIYPTYINYDAIDVDKITNIPMDYDGIMGVPLTFLGQYNAEQFEIVGLGHGDLGKSVGVGENITDEEFKQYHTENSNIRRGHTFYRGKDGKLKIPYVKVLIRRKQQEVQ